MDDGMQASHDDAQLILRLYEIRREQKMREAREWFAGKFNPRSIDDVKAVWFDSSHPYNSHFRMVTSYWDMAASFVVRGALHGRLFLDSASEMVMVWAVLEDYIPQLRKETKLRDYLGNIETVINGDSWAIERLEWFRGLLKQRREKNQS
jgi:hypothetical protein